MTTTDWAVSQVHNPVQNGEEDRFATQSTAVELCGVWAPCLTPILEDLSIDTGRLCKHVEWLLSNGCQGVVLFGTTGEAASFSCAERKSALEALIFAGVAPSRIMVGNGYCAISETIDVTRHAVALGLRSVLMIPPFYFKNPSVPGLVATYRQVIDAVNCPDLKVLLYHFPRMSTVPILHELIDELIGSHGSIIAGLKDSTGSWDSTKAYIDQYPTMSIFPGTDTLLLKGLQSGGAGTITATADINPHGISRVYQLWQAGDDAQAAQGAADQVRAAVSQYPLAAALKAVHANLSGDMNWNRLRPPLMPLSAEEQAELMDELNTVGFEWIK